ncbi:peroxidase family protein [Paracraurococcus ruber]|uniref:Peroxidase n=1 Tax=Paracraurococcus ruber TaxID=77675 RepID=A0ABS1D0T5_9PROT|nr:peroxidase family protein [Paracraurococcus ruber]MBK1660268.1 hypothetical protein [Paracraurococcus ruber]
MDERSIDGWGNSATLSTANAAGTAFLRLFPARYADNVSVPMDGPNPRVVSNLVVGEGDANVGNERGLSGMLYAWGQFIDHDLSRTPIDRSQVFNILVPDGDPAFAPGSVISAGRAVTDAATGGMTDLPATAVNAVTGWLDASMVYGSDPETAARLRLPNGHMRMSEGRNLPVEEDRFLAGDVRAMENPSLTALQTLFVREHNWWVDRLADADPYASGDALFGKARGIVAAEIAQVTYGEFLPHLLGPDAIPSYTGYDPTVDPRISLEFAGAAYRWGHSTVSPVTERKDEQGVVQGGEMALHDAFFLSPNTFVQDGGADAFLRHLASDVSQAMDARIVEDLRNLLVDPPVAQDLAAINIQRGRDLGLPTLNEVRTALGLAPYVRFEELTDDTGTAAGLAAAFGSTELLDLWTGGLAEQPRAEAFIGETFARILTDQFTRLRDGDPFWHQAGSLDSALLAEISSTRLSDIILRNTDIHWLQDDAFLFAERRAADAVSEEATAPQLVIGTDEDEVLAGGPADDILVGAGGDDLALYPATFAEVELIRRDRDGWLLTGPAGTDQLIGIERLRLEDVELRLDTFDWPL